MDGTYDPTDETLANVKVELYAGACPADLTTLADRLADTTSDANGAYLFDEVPAGDYCVDCENPGGFEAHEGASGSLGDGCWLNALYAETSATRRW